MRRSAKMGLYALVIAGLVGGTVAWASTDKTVSVSVDGQARTVHTMAHTVGAVLHDAKVPVGGHDALAPSAPSSIGDHGRIVVLRGRLLHLSIDGQRKDVWTTAQTVDEALAQLGYGRRELVGVSRSKRLPLSPTTLALVTPKRVAVTADGTTRTVETTEQTVGGLFDSMDLALGKWDSANAAMSSAVRSNQHIVVKRVVHKAVTKNVPIPYGTQTTKNPSAYEGDTTVVTEGKDGVQQQVFLFVYVDGKLYRQTLVSKRTVTAPVDKQQKVGTKTRPTTGSTGSGSGSTGSGSGSSGGAPSGGSDPTPVGDAQAIAKSLVDAHGWGSGEFGCLVNLWNRESGWRTNAYNPSGAYGIPQALPGSKMASAGPDWQTNARTQITWGLSYISGVYGSPCNAWAHSNNTGWY